MKKCVKVTGHPHSQYPWRKYLLEKKKKKYPGQHSSSTNKRKQNLIDLGIIVSVVPFRRERERESVPATDAGFEGNLMLRLYSIF